MAFLKFGISPWGKFSQFLANISCLPYVYPALSVTVARIRLCDFFSNGFNPKVGLELRTSVNKDLSFQMDFMVSLLCKTTKKQTLISPNGYKKG